MSDEWTTVELRGDGLNVVERSTKLSNATNWCRANFGISWDDNSSGRWCHNIEVFWFREQRDATMFILRWG